MGTSAYENKDKDYNDPSERSLRSQMVISYLRHRKFADQELCHTPEERSINNEILDQESPVLKPHPPGKVYEDVINPSVLRAVKSKVIGLSQKPCDLRPEELLSLTPGCNDIFERNYQIHLSNDIPAEPSKISIVKKKTAIPHKPEIDSFDFNSIQPCTFVPLPVLPTSFDYPEDLHKISILKSNTSADRVSLNAPTLSFFTHRLNCKISHSSEPVVPEIIPSMNSSKMYGVFSNSFVSEEFRPSLAANVFSRDHTFRENPKPLKPLAQYLNNKGKLNHEDEIRISNRPSTVKELLRQVTEH